ncbi:MAG: hypothetical protein K2P45_02275 [Eubacterium sp.]|nr:hypothetical protein [Eubacterium sp.]
MYQDFISDSAEKAWTSLTAFRERNFARMETVSPRVKAVVGENGKIESGLLEQMWPNL